MTQHPLLLGIAVVDLSAALLVGWAAVTAAQVALAWAPEQATRSQLSLESRFEISSLLIRSGLALLWASTGALILAITIALPGLVPGAMCGTGVLNAMQGLGSRALALRGLALGVLSAWLVLDRLDRSAPCSPLAPATAQTVLVATPLVWLAVGETLRSTWYLNVHEPVSCCTVVYDQVRRTGISVGSHGTGWVWTTTAVGCLLLGLAVALPRTAPRFHRRLGGLVGLLALAWVPLAAVTLVQVLASYHYGVLSHHCPWCLFLPEHQGVGFLAFGALAGVASEGIAAWVASATGTRHPTVSPAAAARTRLAGWRLAAGLLIYGWVAGLPPILYRFRYGVWLDGSQ